MEFKDIFREERYFCNHLFRFLCHKKEDGGKIAVWAGFCL